MKTKHFSQRLFGILTFIILMATLSGCCCDEDDNNNTKTYLELYEGTTWVIDDTGGVPDLESLPDYFRMLNNEDKILEGWKATRYDNEYDCYIYLDGINVEGGNMTVTENSENKLIIKITYGSTETETFTCTVQNDILTIVYLYEEDGQSPETNTITYNKTDVDVDSLTICS